MYLQKWELGQSNLSITLAASFFLFISSIQIDLNRFKMIEYLFCKLTSDYDSADLVASSTTKNSHQIINKSTSQIKGQVSSTSQVSSNSTNYLDSSIEDELTTNLNHPSFRQNILFINSLEGLFPSEYLDNKRQLVINKTLVSSELN